MVFCRNLPLGVFLVVGLWIGVMGCRSGMEGDVADSALQAVYDLEGYFLYVAPVKREGAVIFKTCLKESESRKPKEKSCFSSFMSSGGEPVALSYHELEIALSKEERIAIDNMLYGDSYSKDVEKYRGKTKRNVVITGTGLAFLLTGLALKSPSGMVAGAALTFGGAMSQEGMATFKPKQALIKGYLSRQHNRGYGEVERLDVLVEDYAAVISFNENYLKKTPSVKLLLKDMVMFLRQQGVVAAENIKKYCYPRMVKSKLYVHCEELG